MAAHTAINPTQTTESPLSGLYVFRCAFPVCNHYSPAVIAQINCPPASNYSLMPACQPQAITKTNCFHHCTFPMEPQRVRWFFLNTRFPTHAKYRRATSVKQDQTIFADAQKAPQKLFGWLLDGLITPLHDSPDEQLLPRRG